MPSYPHRHLIGIAGLTPAEITFLLDEAEQWVEFNRAPRKRDARLEGLTQVNAFFENSTRTLLSFEMAGKRLGAQVVNMYVAQSSVQKGETLIDTALTINAMRPDVFVMRHSAAGAAYEVSEVMDCPVINGGDGWGEHPTQALLDALAIRRRKGRIEGLKVAICGDIRHSRVARSNLIALQALGARPRVVGPQALLPPAETLGAVPAFTDMDEGVAGADVVMMLRIQLERMDEGTSRMLDNYHEQFGLTRARLERAGPDAIVMHPGPINRGVEIDSDVADDPLRSIILDQVELGVAVRMACLDVLTRERRGAAGEAV
jgi:aspartate carbamoyltransferase catalytic subunit